MNDKIFKSSGQSRRLALVGLAVGLWFSGPTQLLAGEAAANTPDVLPGKGVAQHDFFYAGESKQERMFIVQNGAIIWAYTHPSRGEISDAVLEPDGNILFAHQFGVTEISADKRVIWNFDVPPDTEIHTAQPFGTNRVWFIQNGDPAKFVAINKATGSIEREFILPGKNPKSTHGQFRHARMTDAGTLLVAHMDLGKAVEYDLNGKELWSLDVPGIWSATPLKNGKILVVSNQKFVREVNRAGKTVWEWTPADAPEYKFHNLQLTVRLPDGNTIINDWFNQWSDKLDTNNPPVQAIEVIPDKKIVWALRSWKPPADLGPATTIQILDATTPVLILTPKPAPTPRINGPKIFGVRPGSPFLYSIPATGARPMIYAVDNLPDGLKLDPQTGHITGVLNEAGEHTVTLHASNALGTAEKPFRIVVGENIQLTPAMGWNSYNCFGTGITEDRELRAARAMVSSGLAQHGWAYVNMDDGWSARERGGPLHALQADPRRFTDLKTMVDQIHSMGLKAGLYSSPWTITYGGRLGGSSDNPDGVWPAAADMKAKKNARQLPFAIGKYSFATNDAEQFAEWGFDYLKYDWGPVEAPETKEMYQALRATHRDIVFSLSNNHVKNLFKIIGDVSPWSESWRTTTDINDNWKRVALDIGFAQDAWAPFARPGHFNDPDMLVVGQVGWFGPLRPTRLTPDEQYTHISLWCLLSAPLLLGCDLEKLDDFTLSLLSNDEVLEVDQDSLGRQAMQVGGEGGLKVYAKPMGDGSLAVGLFNTGPAEATVAANWADLKISGMQRVRDLWRQKDLGAFNGKFETPVASHGLVLVRIFSEKQ